jgi:hypothetical protein
VFQQDKSFIRLRSLPPHYDEVFVAAMTSANNYYHRLIEQLPRVAPYVEFLRRNPTIRIHVMLSGPAKSNAKVTASRESLTAKLLVAMGIPDAGDRIVSGLVRATVAYVPRYAECLWSRPVELQIMSHQLRRHTRSNLFSGGSAVSSSSSSVMTRYTSSPCANNTCYLVAYKIQVKRHL